MRHYGFVYTESQAFKLQHKRCLVVNVTQRCINMLWADKEALESVCEKAATEIHARKRIDDPDDEDVLYLERLIRNYESALAQLEDINARIPVLMVA
jgi:hypothetical protein